MLPEFLLVDVFAVICLVAVSAKTKSALVNSKATALATASVIPMIVDSSWRQYRIDMAKKL
ncbi:MAG: hypothetical protein JSR61_20800 [Proteobacteria bacterium]|nr:hypothetical protein [Pseudomonadota bacterium]